MHPRSSSSGCNINATVTLTVLRSRLTYIQCMQGTSITTSLILLLITVHTMYQKLLHTACPLYHEQILLANTSMLLKQKKKTGNNTNWSLLAQKAGGNIECFRIILRVVGASFLCIADSVGLQEFKVKMWKVAIIGRYSCWSTALFNRHKLLTLLNTSLQCTV